MLRSLTEPLRMLVLLPLRLTRRTSLLAARESRRWEETIERALDDHLLLHWDGAAPSVNQVLAEPTGGLAPAPQPAPGSEHGELTEDELTEWAQMPFAAATARAAELDQVDLRHLLDYERSHGHRLRFEQLLARRVELLERDTG